MDVDAVEMKCLVCVDTQKLNPKSVLRVYKEITPIMKYWNDLDDLITQFAKEVSGKQEFDKYELELGKYI